MLKVGDKVKIIDKTAGDISYLKDIGSIFHILKEICLPYSIVYVVNGYVYHEKNLKKVKEYPFID